MLDPEDVARAVMFALTQPERVNIDELRLSHS
jgi:NADP-dependent 3-hydroxy acid dehydrogenase YdfG